MDGFIYIENYLIIITHDGKNNKLYLTIYVYFDNIFTDSPQKKESHGFITSFSGIVNKSMGVLLL